MIRVLLAEDQAMVRGALAALLALEPDIEVVGALAEGEGAWRELQRLRPDVLVTDIERPGLTGLELAQRIQRHELPVKVVIVTTFARGGFLRRALEAGVAGYLLKDAPAERLAEALRQVHRGGRAIDPELALEAWGEADPLNERERQVLRLPAKAAARPRSPPSSTCRRARCATTCPRRSASWASATGSRPIASLASAACCKPRLRCRLSVSRHQAKRQLP